MKKQFVILFLTGLLLACGEANIIEEANDASDPILRSITSERAKRAQEVFQTIPSPMETATIFLNTETTFNPEIANPPNKQDNYIANAQKALNLGVYGADLSYTNVFGQSQQSMIYINCSKKLADALNVSSAFDMETVERIENNINNRDSLMIIINDAFWIIDRHLNSNGQDHLSALIMVGGWIEGLYLGTETVDQENPDPVLVKRIADQKSSLTSLMDLLITYDNIEVIELEREMKPLQEAYARIDENAVDPAIIFEIAEVAAKIRNNITE